QLTQRPRPTTEPRLDVPEIGPMFASGKVILRVWINELGNVDSVDVEKSELAAAVAATAAAAFGKQRFVPGEINGRPVGSMMRIEVTYDDGTRPP
ncbi:MAG: TonB family protein, partial [Betaproteobacteria bacterium]|nr:TonB family protein [Betaproteobacteria bacterium]